MPKNRGKPFFDAVSQPGLKGAISGTGLLLADAVGIGWINPHGPKSGYQFFGVGIGKNQGKNYWTGKGYGKSFRDDKEVRTKLGKRTVIEMNKSWGRGLGKASLRFGGQALGLGFSAYTLYDEISAGAEENGFWGGVAGIPKAGGEIGKTAAVVWAANRYVFKGGGTALKASWGGIKGARSISGLIGRGLGPIGGHAMKVVGRLAAAPLVVTYAIWSKTLGDVRKDAALSTEAHYNSLAIGNVGNLAAFQTQGAWTSRQMAVQAIQRSHLNARSALGNEAAYVHRLGY